MKSKIWLFGVMLAVLFSLGSCKQKQSAYKAAYEKAKEKEMEENTGSTQIEEVTPVSKPKTTTTTTPSTSSSGAVAVQKEKITTVDGTGLKRFSVVIGSFMNKTNATSLSSRMKSQGYNVIIAQNEKQMYRVIVASYDNKTDAANERDAVKEKYNPDFQDAWILEQQ